MRFWGFHIGPFIFGRVREDVPQSSRARLWTWLATIAIVFTASVPCGLALAIPTAIYLVVEHTSRTTHKEQS